MANELPRYRAQATIQPGPAVSQAGAYQGLSQVAGRVAQMGEQIMERGAVQQGRERGAQAGEALDFQPVAPIGAASQAYNQAGLQANKYAVGADILQQSQKLYQQEAENLQGQKSLDNFNALFDTYAQSLLQSVPAENRPYVQNLLQRQAFQYTTRLQNQIKAQNKLLMSGETQASIQTYQNEALNAARNGDQQAALSYHAQTLNMIQSAAEHGLITPSQYASYKKALPTQLQAQFALGGYERALEEGRGRDYIEQFKKDKSYDKYLAPNQKDALIHQMERLGQQDLAAKGVNAQSVKNLRDNILFKAKNGEAPDPSDVALVNQYDPNHSEDFEQSLHRAQEIGALYQSSRFTSIGHLQEAIAHLREPPTPKELKRPDAMQWHADKVQLANRLAQDLKQLQDDPAGYVQQDPVYQQSVQQASQLGNVRNQAVLNPNLGEEAHSTAQILLEHGQLPTPVDTLLQREQQMGVPANQLSVLPKAVAGQIVQTIRAMNPGQQMQVLEQVEQEYGSHAPLALRDLNQAGLPMSTNLLVGMRNNPDSAPYIPEAMNAFSEKIPELEKALPSDVRPQDVMTNVKAELGSYFDSLSGYNGPTTQTINNMTQKAYQMALYLIGSKHISAGDAEQQAADALINNHYDYPSYNGQVYRVPKDFNSGLAKSAAAYTQTKVLQNAFRVPPSFEPQADAATREYDYQQNALTGYLVTLPDDSGVAYVDHSGTPVKDKDGQPYQFSFHDLENPDAQMMEALHSTSTKLRQAHEALSLSTLQLLLRMGAPL